MRRVIGTGLATVVLSGVLLVVASMPASAAPTGFLWGPRYTNSFLFHQNRAGGNSGTLVSADGKEQFSIQNDGNLVTYKRFSYPYAPYVRWNAYWSSRTNSLGRYLSLQRDGNIVERAADNRTVLWASNHHPGTQYNYWLVMQNDGNLVEYYSTGDPRVGGRVAWATNRLTTRHICTGGPIAPASPAGTQATTSFLMHLQDDDRISVKVINPSVLSSLTVTVSRWRNKETGPLTWIIPPHFPWQAANSHTFSGSWYSGINTPTYVTMHIRTPSNGFGLAVVGSYQATGDCWYLP